MNLRRLAKTNPLVRRALYLPIMARRAAAGILNRSRNDLLDRITADIVGDLIVKAPEFGAIFAMSPRSHIFHRLALFGSYEPAVTKAFLSLIDPERDVLDIGANVGFYTVAAAKKLKGGRVFAIEPTTGAFGRLQRNIDLNQVQERVAAFKLAISDHDGEVTLRMPRDREEYASVGGLVHPNTQGAAFIEETVPAMTLDSFVRETGARPSMIKVDVEGAEGMVFAGAHEVLTQHRPIIVAELVDLMLAPMGSSVKAITDLLTGYGYRVSDAEFEGAKPGTTQEIIAIPAELSSPTPR